MHKKSNNFSFRIGLANDATVRSWSQGEVTKSETLNYKTEKPVSDGLFCEKIFGPVKDYECSCGRYKSLRFKGKICEVCGVLVTESIERRWRMGHIELDDPVVHIWYLKSIPTTIPVILDLPQLNIEKITYYQAYSVVENNNDDEIKIGDIIELNISKNESESRIKPNTIKLIETLLRKSLSLFEINSVNYEEVQNMLFQINSGEDSIFFIEEFIYFINEETPFKLQTGGLAIETLLKRINLQKEIDEINKKISFKKSFIDSSSKIVKRLRLLNNFLKTGQKPEWMVTRTIPVLPPELRPIVHLDGGRFAISGINKLYAQLIMRKNRLIKHREKYSPMFMTNQLRFLIQDAVDELFDKTLTVKARKKIQTKEDKMVKSIAENLKGKTGRFRQNLLGKRVDYSGGSVIVGGPDLKLNQCGIPREIAITLFKTMIVGRLLKNEIAINKKQAEKIVFERKPVVWEILEDLIKDYPVILNRAPTLHRLGIQGFFPKLVRGNAIKLHPLVTTAFNADFDGDRMPIHLPLTKEAKEEVKDILLSTNNILNPRNGQIIIMPSQDIVLGIYYLTYEKIDELGAFSVYGDKNFIKNAYYNKKLSLNAPIFVLTSILEKEEFKDVENKFVITTLGKIIFNEIFPSKFKYINGNDWNSELKIYDLNVNIKELIKDFEVKPAITKAVLSKIINNCFDKFGNSEIIKVLDNMKDLGFKYSTKSGVTLSIFDLESQKTNKKDLFKEVQKSLDKADELKSLGMLTSNEMRTKKIEIWTDVKEKVENQLSKYFEKGDLRSSIYAMVKSGARGSISNVTQLIGMRGLMVNTNGMIIDTPIKSSFYEGLNILEYFISTYGARKGMVDTALKTADSGYLTRRLVDITHDFYTIKHDCLTSESFEVKEIISSRKTVIELLEQRIYGRFSAEDILNKDGQIIVSKNELITNDLVNKIIQNKIKSVKIRSVLTCSLVRGVCQLCYGIDLSKNKIIELREAVGILAAQSIGEPATQLTMRTFHTGGVSDVSDITQGLPRVIELFDVISPENKAMISYVSGKVKKVRLNADYAYEILIVDPKTEKEITTYVTKRYVNLIVKSGDLIEKGDRLTRGSVDLKELLKVTLSKQKVCEYIIKEIQKIYYLQGIDLSDKYIEIIVKKMLSRSKVKNFGDSNFIFGEELDNYIIEKTNNKLLLENKKIIEFEPIISGTKSLATKTYSFLSAASFQETTKVLIQSVIENRTDNLYGLKENVIVGNLIPIGLSYRKLLQKKEE